MGSGHAATAAVAVGGLNRGRTVAGSPGKPKLIFGKTLGRFEVNLASGQFWFNACFQGSILTTLSASRSW